MSVPNFGHPEYYFESSHSFFSSHFFFYPEYNGGQIVSLGTRTSRAIIAFHAASER